MSFNEISEKSPSSILIMDRCECRCSTGIHNGTFIAFDLHKRLAKQFTV